MMRTVVMRRTEGEPPTDVPLGMVQNGALAPQVPHLESLPRYELTRLEMTLCPLENGECAVGLLDCQYPKKRFFVESHRSR